MSRADSIGVIDYADALEKGSTLLAAKVAAVVKVMTDVAPHLTAREIRLIEIAARVTIANEVLRREQLKVKPSVSKP